MDYNSAIELAKSLGEIVLAVLTVLGLIRRQLDSMISKKVEAQLKTVMDEMTKTTSGELASIRQEIRTNHGEQLQRTDDRFDALTNRIDRLINN